MQTPKRSRQLGEDSRGYYIPWSCGYGSEPESWVMEVVDQKDVFQLVRAGEGVFVQPTTESQQVLVVDSIFRLENRLYSSE